MAGFSTAPHVLAMADAPQEEPISRGPGSAALKSLEKKMDWLMEQFQDFAMRQKDQHEQVITLMHSRATPASSRPLGLMREGSGSVDELSDEDIGCKRHSLRSATDDICAWKMSLHRQESRHLAQVVDEDCLPVQAMSSLPSVGDMQAAFAFSINAPRHRRKEKEAHFDARSQPSTPGPGSPSRPLVDLPEGPHAEPSRLMPTLSAIPSGPFEPQKSVLQFDLPNGAGDDTEDVKREAVRSLSGVVEDNEQGDKNEDNLLMRSPPSSPQMDNMISLSKKSNTVILHQYNTIEDAEPPGSLEDLGCSICVKVPWLAACLPVVLSATSLAFMYHEDIVGHNFTMVSAAVYSLCSVSCLWLLRRALLSEELVLAVGKLHVFVDTFKNQWGKRSRQEQCWSFAVWLVLVLGFVAGEAYEEWKEMELPDTYANSRLILKALSTVSFGLSSGILVLVAYVQCHFLLGLDTSLDCWCASLLDEPDFSLGVESWPLWHGMASWAQVAFQRSFDREVMLMEGLRSLPLLLHFLLEMHVFSRGATLTQKCRIIPSFVNQIPSATLLNPARSYLVQFVTDSSAGFLVRDVKLTPEMFLKIFVLIGGILSALVGVLSRLCLTTAVPTRLGLTACLGVPCFCLPPKASAFWVRIACQPGCNCTRGADAKRIESKSSVPVSSNKRYLISLRALNQPTGRLLGKGIARLSDKRAVICTSGK
ncbi:unnamed protein product [Effrenium voratum]|nr:unnamed protein product [Effrenium voratum]